MNTVDNVDKKDIKVVGKAYALLIGVDDYHAFDPTRRHNLPGSVNDVIAWRNTLLRRGYEAGNIRILVSPIPEALATLGAHPATKDNIEKGLSWLEHQLADKDHTAGVFTFSGHGDVDEKGRPVICPVDTHVSGDHLEKTIYVSHIVHSLPRNAVVFLDCCHSGPPELVSPPIEAVRDNEKEPSAARLYPVGRAVLLALRGGDEVGVDMKSLRNRPIQCRVVSAASEGGVAFQAEFMGRFQGALTWAVTSALGQWKVVPEDHGVPPSVTLSSLGARDHAEALLSSIALPQTTMLYGAPVDDPAHAKRIPLLGYGIEGLVAADPDGRRIPEEFPPDLKVWFGSDGAPATPGEAGEVSAVGYAPPTGYRRNLEYWRLTDAFLNDVNGAAPPSTQLQFLVDTTQSPPSWDNIITAPPKRLFTMPLVPTWANCPYPNATGYYAFDTNGPPAAVFFNLIPPQLNGGNWGGSITWYRVYQGNPNQPVFGSAGRTFNKLTALPNAYKTLQWQKVILTPTNV